jgi:tetratricopeptide (TPR) repeat protein
MKAMKLMRCIAALVVSVSLFACGQGEDPSAQEKQVLETVDNPKPVLDPALVEIRSMEQRARKDTVLDRTTGLRLLRAYQDYYNRNPQDSLALSFLFEAGKVADAMGKYDKAIELFANYHDASKDISRKAEAAYLVAFIYDAHMHRAKDATKQYNKVIELYPNSTWAVQAKQALHLVGKSDEELLRFLKEKNPS